MPIEVISAYNIDDKANHNRMTCAYSEITECPICHHALVRIMLKTKTPHTIFGRMTYTYCVSATTADLCFYAPTGQLVLPTHKEYHFVTFIRSLL